MSTEQPPEPPATQPTPPVDSEARPNGERPVRDPLRGSRTSGTWVAVLVLSLVLLNSIAARTESEADAPLRRAASLSTGDFTVLHVSLKHPRQGLVAVETHSPA